ncbi:MAG TPA: penicillin acylase family protein [Puia sp.]|uniref:penicillin acylase family protein n=1 Tax=Puia sp. TaxID=2045100 RepID=UPI002D1752B9|nr:penicillin acylase family protein [Puia sp.]HVU94501.1 penicillin acylase family protein [Puia sp.]
MKYLAGISLTLLTIGVIYLLDNHFGRIPPLGKVLSPGDGIWKNAEPVTPSDNALLSRPEVHDPVLVKYDSLGVPHIFCSNDYDLYFTQGFVTAKDRLWQMDIQVRKALGTLAEIAGPALLEEDKYYRRIGLRQSALQSMALMLQNDTLRNALEAYAAGVNAYIDSLSPDRFPIEFKLLDYRPARWLPLYSVLIMKLFAETLSGASDDLAMSNTLAGLGPKATSELFPDHPTDSEFAVPPGTRWNFKCAAPASQPISPSTSRLTGNFRAKKRMEGIGSNCWVTNRTSTTHPLLANDPHLTLSYPSVWYQLQLQTPAANTCGVSIPGIPFIVIGFNDHIAWGMTNMDADVLDWYAITFRDQTKNEYKYGNTWRPTSKNIQHLHVRGQPDVDDTVVSTHYGPVVYENIAGSSDENNYNHEAPPGFAMRWTGAIPSQDLLTFYLLNRAVDYPAFRNALQYFQAPAQNFLYADTAHIAYVAGGLFPIKRQDQGKFLLDGASPADEWNGFIPTDQLPAIKDPARGYLFSANQAPADSSYPYYINWQFAGSERAARIHQLLARRSDLTAQDMERMQNDNYSIFADQVLDTLLSDISHKPTLSSLARQCRDSLLFWNRYYDPHSMAATIFSAWWAEFFNQTWQDEFGGDEDHRRYPSRATTAELLLHAPFSAWFDNKHTPAHEDRRTIAGSSFIAAVQSLKTRFGDIGPRWQWSAYKHASIQHVFQLPGLGSGDLETGGSSTAVNAMTTNFGPSWRMVVQTGAEPIGFGIYPGGQSGNPGSPNYDNFTGYWLKGEYRELPFLTNKSSRLPGLSTQLIINPQTW